MRVAQPEEYRFDDLGDVPSSRLPVLVYHGVDGAGNPTQCTELFASNGWLGAWVNGIFPL
jgi:uncharacterized protein YjlB